MESQLNLLPLAASLCLFIALIQAWIMTAMRYFNASFLKSVFKNYRFLVLSHIDYLMMSGLVFGVYLTCVELSIDLPHLIKLLIFIGALYNPFGFLLQSIKPDIAESGTLMSKVGIALGFMPLTIGLGWASIALIETTLG
jgi:hypothetical protein